MAPLRLCLLGLLLCLYPTAAGAQAAKVVDALYDCAGDASPDGTPLTVPILNNCTQGTSHGANTITGTATSLTISSTPGINRPSVDWLRGVGGSVAANGTTRRIAYDNLANNTSFVAAAPYVTYQLTRAVCITFGVNNAGVGGSVFDNIRIENVAGDWAIIQLNNGNDGTGHGYAYNLHTNPGGVSTTTGNTTIAQGSSHCFSLHMNSLLHTASLYVYDTSWVQEAHITASTNSGCGTSGDTCRMKQASAGNAEVGIGVGTTFFWGIEDDWGTASDPLIPIFPYFVEKYCGTTAAGSAAGMPTCAVTNVVAGDLGVSLMGWSGTTTTIASSTDGTTGWTASAIGVKDNSGANGEPHLSMRYLLSSVAAGSVTLTNTLSAARTFRDTSVMYIQAPTGYTWALDGTATSSESSGSTALSTGSITPAANLGFCVSSYAEFGALLYVPQINAVQFDASSVATGANSLLWAVNYTFSFAGNGTGTLAASNRWTAGIICFKLTAPASSGTLGRMLLLRAG